MKRPSQSDFTSLVARTSFHAAFWFDAIIHAIHLRVLNHVKQLSEASEP